MLVHSKLLLSIARSFPRDVDDGVDGGQARLASSEMRVKGEKATGRRRDDQAGAQLPAFDSCLAQSKAQTSSRRHLATNPLSALAR